MKLSKVEAPMRSPAAANTVFGCSARRVSTAVTREAPPAPPFAASGRMRPWKSLMPRIWMVVSPSAD
jgi:hypothetical protein